MSSPELVTVTVDGREIQVPKGQGMIETALEAGIEIPVFCYEPRLGAPVGACRMCLCEVEGMPKLQAACTMTAQDGLVLSTAQTSAKAAEGQNAVLEFILLNHPLDCPDCDKGGECPLQDLTFRWGPGTTRMRFPKRTFDKPIPVSPLIALDRERCILCYRCTRFSETVAEDGQLVAINRGAGSVIATFEDEPYRAHFSGNVLELCPVGALTSTTYRFRARPWEIQNVPTVCGLCPVGCNTWATTREGKVARILSRNHAEVDEGWLCDKGRFAYAHLKADDRISVPRRRVRRRGFEPVSWRAGSRRGRARPEGGRRPGGRRLLGRRDRRDGHRNRTTGQGRPRRRQRTAPGHLPSRPRPLPRADLGDPRRGCLPRLRGRARRRASPGSRPLAPRSPPRAAPRSSP